MSIADAISITELVLSFFVLFIMFAGRSKGSLIDNIAVIANAQKSEDYQRALKSYEDGKKSNAQFSSIAQQHADLYFEAELKLIDMLANTPGGEKYVAGEIAIMEKVKGLLSKKA